MQPAREVPQPISRNIDFAFTKTCLTLWEESKEKGRTNQPRPQPEFHVSAIDLIDWGIEVLLYI